MPPTLVARKSGIHRAACFALFRALFRQVNCLGLVQPQKSALVSRLRKGIRDNLKEQSNPAILAALRRGYALLKVLHEGVDKSLNSAIHTFDFATIPIIKTPSPHERPLSLPSESPRKVTNRSRRGPMVWPQPNTTSIFDRPFPKVSGRRRVPHLVVTSGFPFLRIKKPQSQFLGRIIRDDIRLFHKRVALFQKLQAYSQLGYNEDRWDEILESMCGIDGDRDVGSWIFSAYKSKQEVGEVITKHRQQRLDMAQKMQEIVEKEQALADQERLQRMNEKHKERKQRRLERKAPSDEAV